MRPIEKQIEAAAKKLFEALSESPNSISRRQAVEIMREHFRIFVMTKEYVDDRVVDDLGRIAKLKGCELIGDPEGRAEPFALMKLPKTKKTNSKEPPTLQRGGLPLPPNRKRRKS